MRLMFLILSFISIATPFKNGEHEWYTSISSNVTRKLRKILHTINGDIVGIGYELNSGDVAHLLFARLDKYGNIKCVKVDTVYYEDFAFTIVELPDGKFLWAGGMRNSSNEWYRPAYGVIDSIGNPIWTFSIDSLDTFLGDYIKDAALTPENNVIMITRYGYIIITALDGNLVTLKPVPPSSWDYGWDAAWYFYKIYRTPYNDFIIIGERDSDRVTYWYQYSKAAIVRVNSLGDTLWARVFDNLPYADSGYTNTFFFTGSMAMNRRVVLSGMIADTEWSQKKAMVCSIDLSTGDTIRCNFFEIPTWLNEIATIRNINFERYIVLSSYQQNKIAHAKLFVLNSNLEKEYTFEYVFPCPASLVGFPTNMIQMPDGGYVFAMFGDSTGGSPGMRVIKPDPGFFVASPFKITNPHDTLYLDTADVDLDILWQGPMSRYGNISYEVYLDDSLIGKTPGVSWNISGIMREELHTIIVRGEDNLGVYMIPWEDTSYILVKTYPYINCISQLHDTVYPGPFKVLAEIIDIPSGIDSAFLFYRRSYEDSNWVKVNMRRASDTGDIYYAVIPRCLISPGPDTIRFYLAAYDGANPPHESFSPPHAPVKYYEFVANSPSGSREKGGEKKSQYVNVNTTIKGVIFEIYSLKDDKISLNIWNFAGRSVYATRQNIKAGKVYLIKFKPPVKGVYFYKLKGRILSKEGRIFYW